MSSKPTAPEPTEIDGRYVIEKKLGAGAFGTVYKARDKELGRLVAIKTIRLEGLAASTSSLDDLLARFKREAQVAASLRHPNIVALWDWKNTQEGFAYISMEFVDGVGLDRVIASSGKMSVERAAAIGYQVADALAVAHKHGIVHRDIKPANIMIEAGDHVKVTDFGIAKMQGAAEHLTMTGSLLGTPSYMSPEQARGGEIDARSDLFSLGCVLYEMVLGQKAFRGDSITALLFKIITEEPPPLREIDPTVSDEMVRIIGKALSKAPETRYQTGRELADDLLATTRPGYLPTLRAAETPTLPPDAPPGDVPTIASPPTARAASTVSSADTAARPPAAPVAPPPLPPTVLTPSTAASPPPPPPSPRRATPSPRPPAPAARRGGGMGLVLGLGAAAILAVAVVGVGGWYLLSRRTPEPAPTPTPDLTATTPASSAATEAVPGPAEATPPPEAAAAAPVSTPAPAASATVAPPPVSSPPSRRADAAPIPPSSPSSRSSPTAAGGGPAARSDYAYLDDIPPETPDGRAAGEALANKYRSGGSSGYPTGRFNRRERFPRNLVPAERPAAATLGYILVAEEKYHRQNGRYATLRELNAAQLFFLDVPFQPDSFQRARYHFKLTLEGDGFRAEAQPIGPVGRPLLVDDSGFVQIDRE